MYLRGPKGGGVSARDIRGGGKVVLALILSTYLPITLSFTNHVYL